MTADGISGDTQAPALKLFIGGDRSQVGKSTVCLGILGSLLELGYSPSDLAYIKPVTQCEQPQLISKWCAAKGVACRGIGPVVFYAGFTRAFLKGEAGTSEQLLVDAKAAVDEISKGKRFVVVDGVGYPAVGSICGISNADTAAALHTPVLLVGRSGVGDAVDSFNLNATFFKSHGVEVLGGVFNRLASGGFYSLANCREAVTNYFARVGRQMPYGFVPDAQPMLEGKLEVAAAHTDEALSAAVAARGGGLVLVVSAQPECPVLAACKPLLLWWQHCEGLLHVLVVNTAAPAAAGIAGADADDNGDAQSEQGSAHAALYYKNEKRCTFNLSAPEVLATSLQERLQELGIEHDCGASLAPSAKLQAVLLKPKPQSSAAADMAIAEVMVAVFSRHVNVQRLVDDVSATSASASDGKTDTAAAATAAASAVPPQVGKTDGAAPALQDVAAAPVLKTRDDIEAAAAASGASGG